jgi:hypothetical protein
MFMARGCVMRERRSAKQFYLNIDIAHEFHFLPAPGSTGEAWAPPLLRSCHRIGLP